MSVCGLWLSAQRLCAVIIEDGGQARTPLTTDCTTEACASLLAWLLTSEVHTVVLSERAQGLIAQAHAAHLRVELVPHQLLEAIRSAAGLTHRAPCHTPPCSPAGTSPRGCESICASGARRPQLRSSTPCSEHTPYAPRHDSPARPPA